MEKDMTSLMNSPPKQHFNSYSFPKSKDMTDDPLENFSAPWDTMPLLLISSNTKYHLPDSVEVIYSERLWYECVNVFHYRNMCQDAKFVQASRILCYFNYYIHKYKY